MPRTPEQYEEIRNEKKQLIMDAALILFANEGFHSTSISKIADKANISKGLMYNYFKSKTDLLKSLIYKLSHELIDMLNPDHDEEISLLEANEFIDKYFNMLKQNNEELKLYFQLTIQPEVIEIVMNDEVTHTAMKSQSLLYNYFLKHSDNDPDVALLHFSSLFKGFAMQYVYAPEMFSDELIERFKNHLKSIFTNTKTYENPN